MSLPARMAARAGAKPAVPTMAMSTVSASANVASSIKPSGPEKIVQNFGLDFDSLNIEDFEEFYKIYWDMEMDADRYGKDWVKKIGDVLKLSDKEYFLDKMVENYPTMSGMIKQMMTQLHNHVQILKKQGMTYTDISDLDIVKKHLDKLEDMF